MSKKDILQNKRSLSIHNHSIYGKGTRPTRALKMKSKLFQKTKIASKSYKKLSPLRIRKETWPSRRVRKATNKGDQPPTPHNTTQFIVDAVYFPTDPYIYEYDNNRFEYDCQHHAMAGSMMQMMQERMNQETFEGGNPQAISPRKEYTFDSKYDIPKLRMVKSADDAENNTTYDSDDALDYDQLLNEVQGKTDLQAVIKELVSVIKKKDNQINTLLSNTQRKEFL